MKAKLLLGITCLSCFGLIVLFGLHFSKLVFHVSFNPFLSEKTSTDASHVRKTSLPDEAIAQPRQTTSVTDTPMAEKNSISTQTMPKESLSEYAKFLKEREEELKKREQALDEKEKALKSLEKELEAKLTRLEEIQKSIEEFNQQQEQMANDRIDALVKIYVTMKPKDAAALLEKLDDDLVCRIISRMATDQAAKIISSMEIKKAARITEKLSEKRSPTFK